MKITFLIDQIYLHGGIEKVLTEKANYFADILHYEVFIFTTQQQGKPPCYPLSDKITVDDLGINYNRTKSYFSFSNLLKIKTHFLRRKSTLKKINPDIVIVCNYDFDFFWIPFINKSSRKIKEYHSSQYVKDKKKSFKKKIISIVTNFIENKYDVLVVLNKDEQSFFKSKNTVVIPNPISIPEFESTLNNKQVLAAGRIAPVKGFERLLEAWALIVAKYPDWELHFYGEDYLGTQSELEKQAKKLRIEKNISFKGVTSKMTNTMLDYSLYMMTSHTESFSMVIVEAFSVGLPTVAFDVPTGPRNLISNNLNGVLIENNDIQGFANEVEDLIGNPLRRKKMGEEAKKSSLYFSNKNVMQEWTKLFYSLFTTNTGSKNDD